MTEQPAKFQIKSVKSAELNESTIGKYLPRGQESVEKILPTVKDILQEVRHRGDIAIQEFTSKFDRVKGTLPPIRVSKAEIETAYKNTSSELVNALKAARINIEKFHAAQIRPPWFIETSPGVKTGQIMRPLERVGLYIPGGRAVYPSTVLMTAAVAKIAGVKELILCSPPQPDGTIASAILVAADLCGVDNIFRCGGAQAIAGMAYGTESIPKVQKIVGPGNKWVAAAKQLVSNECAIDNPAGPSEILLVVDKNTNPLWAAYDLLAQIEHGPDNVAVLLAPSEKVSSAIIEQLRVLVTNSPRNEILIENLNKYGLIILSDTQPENLRMINLVAAEHLHLNVSDPNALLPEIKNAGAIFMGANSPVPLGDYCAGTNHVLPTAGYARYYSGLSTFDFMKVMDVLDCNADGLQTLAKILQPIADFEGLPGHRDAVLIRTKKNQN